MGDNSDVSATATATTSPRDVIQMSKQIGDELMSLKIAMGSKRLLVALCENDRGRYIKLTDGRSRINVPSDGIGPMCDSLVALESNLNSVSRLDDQPITPIPNTPTSTTTTTTGTTGGVAGTSPSIPPASSGSSPPSTTTANVAAAAVANASQQHQHQQQQLQQGTTTATITTTSNNANNNSNNNSHLNNYPHPPHHHYEDYQKSKLIDSQRFRSEERKFYFDVMENSRGKYLKITQSFPRRFTLIVPLTFLPYIKQSIDMLLDKAPPDTTAITDPQTVQRTTRTLERVTPLSDGSSVTLNIVQREIRVMGKLVVFESGANRRGSYIKITENHNSQRTTVMLPHSAVPDIIQLLQEVVASGDPAQGLNLQNCQ